MCIGVPGKVVSIEGIAAKVDVQGTIVEVGILFVPDVKINEYVMIHAGQAMTIVDEEFARINAEEWRALSDGKNI